MATKTLERPTKNGFAIAGKHVPLSGATICKIYSRMTGEELQQVFHINCDTGEYGFYAEGPGGSRAPCLNPEGDGILRGWAFGELIIVFDQDPPEPLLRAMVIPLV